MTDRTPIDKRMIRSDTRGRDRSNEYYTRPHDINTLQREMELSAIDRAKVGKKRGFRFHNPKRVKP